MYAKRKVNSSITKDQIKIIYTLGQELGLVNRTESRDLLHSMVESITEKCHITELSVDEAARVIDRLKNGMKGTSRIKESSSPSRPGMASDAQIRMIWKQMYLLKELDTEVNTQSMQQRLRGFLKKYASVDDIKFLSSEKANSVIEGLKGLVSNEKRRAKKLL